MIVGCVVLIGVGPATGSIAYDTTNLMIAIGWAVATGLLFSFNAVNINYII